MPDIYIDSSPTIFAVDYCSQIASIPNGPPVLPNPSSKEIDLLANPFQTYAATVMSRWAGGNYSINPLPINAEMIGGPRITTSGRRWHAGSMMRIGSYTTGRTDEIARFPPRTVLEVNAGFEFQVFKSTCDSTKVDHVIAGFLPCYRGGQGIDSTVYMDYEVTHVTDAWEPFMQAIRCNLDKNLPTVLLVCDKAWMLLENGRHNPPNEFEFMGYKLEGTSTTTRPALNPLKFTNAFHIWNYEEKYPRLAMAFVAFEPLID